MTTTDHKQENNTSLGGALLLIGVAAIWGTGIVTGKVGMEYLNPFAFTFVRNVLAGAALLVVVLVRDIISGNSPLSAGMDSPRHQTGQSADQTGHRAALWKGGLLCGIFLFAGTYLQHAGLQYVEAGKGGFLMALYMVIVPIISVFMLRQKAPRSLIVCIPLALVALWLLSITDGMTVGKGELLSFLSSFGYTGHILMADRYVGRCDVIRMSVIQFFSGAVLAFIGAAATGGLATLGYLPEIAGPILYCGVIAGGMGFTLQLIGQRYVAASLVGLLLSMEAVFSVLMGFVFLHERLSPREIIGCILMFTAIILSQASQGRSREQ